MIATRLVLPFLHTKTWFSYKVSHSQTSPLRFLPLRMGVLGLARAPAPMRMCRRSVPWGQYRSSCLFLSCLAPLGRRSRRLGREVRKDRRCDCGDYTALSSWLLWASFKHESQPASQPARPSVLRGFLFDGQRVGHRKFSVDRKTENNQTLCMMYFVQSSRSISSQGPPTTGA